MQTKLFFLLCALQIVQFASAQCGCGPAYVPDCNAGYGPGHYSGYAPGLYPGSLPDNYPESLHYPGTLPGSGYERGDIEAAGTLGVEGKVYVDGFVPVEGTVQYGGEVGASGTTSVRCSCGNIWTACGFVDVGLGSFHYAQVDLSVLKVAKFMNGPLPLSRLNDTVTKWAATKTNLHYESNILAAYCQIINCQFRNRTLKRG